MELKLAVALSLAVLSILIDASPVNLIYEDLDSDFNYDDEFGVEEEDLDDFGKILDAADDISKNAADSKAKTNVKTSGFKKKKTGNKGVQSKHDIEDLKKFYKLAGAHDRGLNIDDDVFAKVGAVAAGVVGESANESKKYRKGSKTRGFHRVHHKDEYKKDQEFYEDDNRSGEVKKFGGAGIGAYGKAGVGRHREHFHHDREKGIFGKQGFLDKGTASKEFKGYSDFTGLDGSFSNVN